MKYFKYVWQYFYNLAVAFDQLSNSVLAGDPDETVSRRVARAKGSRPNNVAIVGLAWFIDGIFLLVGETRHVEKAGQGKTKAKEIWNWNKK